MPESLKERVVAFIAPADERRDARFRGELERLSITGLRVVATIFVVTPVMWIAVAGVFLAGTPLSIGMKPAAAILTLGLTSLWLSYRPSVQPHARVLGLIVVCLGVMLDMTVALEMPISNEAQTAMTISSVTLGLLICMAAFPLKPLQALALGLGLSASFMTILFSVGSAPRTLVTSLSLPFILMIVVICAGLTGLIYSQRVAAFRARRKAETAFEELQKAHVRVMVSENAASQSRFAAALSHDLNTPLGALTSAFATVVKAHRREQAAPEDQERLENAIHDATDAGRQAAERLRSTFDRMKHLTNLDQAEERIVNLNDLWRDTVALLTGEFERKADVRLDLEPAPQFQCRPQQMSAVFSHLLRNAVKAIEEHGSVGISSRSTSNEIVFEVRDNGVGIPAEHLSHLFEPSFHDGGDNVTTTNWGFLITNTIVMEHGGRLEIESEEGYGTTVRVKLPLQSKMAASPSGNLVAKA